MRDSLCDIHTTLELDGKTIKSAKAFLWDESGDLTKYIPHATEIKAKRNVVVGKKASVKIFHTIKDKTIEVDGEEATAKETLIELGEQLKGRKQDSERFKKELYLEKVKITDVIFKILNNKHVAVSELMLMIQYDAPDIFNHFFIKYRWCSSCNKYVEFIDHDYFEDSNDNFQECAMCRRHVCL